jgi:predicted ArsR family transcriptional regulator
MPRSMLNLYIDIAKTLTEHGPLPIHELVTFLKVEPYTLKKHLSFLVDNGMVKEKMGTPALSYVIAEPGAELLKFFNVQTLIKV